MTVPDDLRRRMHAALDRALDGANGPITLSVEAESPLHSDPDLDNFVTLRIPTAATNADLEAAMGPGEMPAVVVLPGIDPKSIG